jgi:hypothetical protein
MFLLLGKLDPLIIHLRKFYPVLTSAKLGLNGCSFRFRFKISGVEALLLELCSLHWKHGNCMSYSPLKLFRMMNKRIMYFRRAHWNGARNVLKMILLTLWLI